MDAAVRPFAGVVLLEPLAQREGGDAHDRVGARVEILAAIQRMDGDGVFLDLVGFALEVFGADETQGSDGGSTRG